jgi:methylase of polypeptide subunit release factors
MISLACNDVNNIAVEAEWNFSDNTEFLMHAIHAYPAKFPAFIATKAFEYAEQEGVDVRTVADIFCGCGTVALEAKLHGKDFWGCDINPVATLIAKTKSTAYDIDTLGRYYDRIKGTYYNMESNNTVYEKAPKRLKYWFNENSFIDLLRLKQSIETVVTENDYQDAFLCLFSSILKASSKWLTKSIKPQIDPNKAEIVVWDVFKRHFDKFSKALIQINSCILNPSNIRIENENFLDFEDFPKVDLIISSPPYVTSYEYADLHQLSTLWLQYAYDYRDLRKGSIGSMYNSKGFEIDLNSLNAVGQQIVQALLTNCKATAKVRSVARYYIDIQRAIHNCASMLNDGGMAFFVVGDTEYKGVKIKNSEHLVQCLTNEGLTDIKAAKRRISNKLLTPYRDERGRFSSDKTQRTIYHEEFIISGRMWHQ